MAYFSNDSPSLSGTATYFWVLRKPRLPLVQPSIHSLRHFVSCLWGASTRGSRGCCAPTAPCVLRPSSLFTGSLASRQTGEDLRLSRRRNTPYSSEGMGYHYAGSVHFDRNLWTRNLATQKQIRFFSAEPSTFRLSFFNGKPSKCVFLENEKWV